MEMTTIKVPKSLRDRLAERASRDGVTLAVAIQRALEVADEEAFWAQVAQQNRRSSAAAGTPPSATDDGYDEGALQDDLDPSDAMGRDDW